VQWQSTCLGCTKALGFISSNGKKKKEEEGRGKRGGRK
jgi:hypothetical protein